MPFFASHTPIIRSPREFGFVELIVLPTRSWTLLILGGTHGDIDAFGAQRSDRLGAAVDLLQRHVQAVLIEDAEFLGDEKIDVLTAGGAIADGHFGGWFLSDGSSDSERHAA